MEGVGGQALLHGGRGPCPPPLNNEKKRGGQEILISFTYTLLMNLGGGGDRHTCNMERGGRRGGLAPPRNEKKDVVKGNFNLTYILLIKLEGGSSYMQYGREGMSGQVRAPTP